MSARSALAVAVNAKRPSASSWKTPAAAQARSRRYVASGLVPSSAATSPAERGPPGEDVGDAEPGGGVHRVRRHEAGHQLEESHLGRHHPAGEGLEAGADSGRGARDAHGRES